MMMISNISVSSSLAIPVKSYAPEKNLPCFRKKGETPSKTHRTLMKITPSENPTIEVKSSYLQNCGILYFLPEERSRMYV
jgi:hypothetical protein